MGTKDSCGCGGGKSEQTCGGCAEASRAEYWCDSCKRAVDDKRCPFCGLKARRNRQGG